jgi:RNA polymerase sigma-54 factor
MKTSLGQRQLQLQKLSPQQIQLMKLLQIPTPLLEQRIKEEMEANPALEDIDDNKFEEEPEFTNSEDEYNNEEAFNKEEGFDIEDYLTNYVDDDPSSYKLRGESYNPDEEDRSIPIATESSFHEYLEQQISLLELKDEREEQIARQLIGSIDEDGYLRREPYSVVDDLLFSQNVFSTEAEVISILKRIQRLDPPGIGARDLQECLLIQLRSKLDQEDELEDHEMPAIQLAIKLLDKHFEAFSKKHFEKLQRSLSITERQLKNAVEVIIKLNPKPASAYSGGTSERSSQYIIPDFVILNTDGVLELNLNTRNAPDLRVSDEFRDMLKTFSSRGGVKLTRPQKDTLVFIKQKIESARWFIDAIKQRHETMYKTMYAIMEYQSEYFLTGDQKKMRPMILQDVANMTSLDVSTISRVANSKYVQTEYGAKRLKEFFSEGMQNSEGEEISTLEVKKILSEIITAESKRSPLSDDKLTQVLQEKGYNIARRTVAKYREQLGVPKASLRKTL